MATPLDPAVHKLIWLYGRQKLSHRQIIKVLQREHGIKIGIGTAFKFSRIPPPDFHYSGDGIRSDKKLGKLNWEHWTHYLEQGQKLKQDASYSQDKALIELGDGTHDVAVGIFSDHHIGSWGCNYPLLRQMTHELIETPHFYVGLMGDEGQYSIKLRSVLESADNQLTPEQQTQFLEQWIDHIWTKVAFSTWCNHGVERQEKQAGESSLKKMKSKRMVYFNGIGHVDLLVGDQVYKGAVSHKFRGGSIYNPCHAGMRYMRFEGIDREWTMEGDRHEPGMIKYTDGHATRACINAGSLQLNSGYGKRYFSLTTHPVYPVLVFRHDRHEITPYWSLKEWLDSKSRS